MNECIICGAPTDDIICEDCELDNTFLNSQILYKLSRARKKDKREIKEKEIIENEKL